MNSVNTVGEGQNVKWRGLLRAFLVLAAISWLPVTVVAQKLMMAVDKDLPLSAEQTAEAIGLASLFERVKQLKAAANPLDREEIVLLRQEILLRVTSVSLQVGGTTGEIDAEIAETRELENYLGGRRESKVDLLSLASLGVGSTVGTENSVFGFTKHNLATSVTSLVAGSVTLGLPLRALKVRGGQMRVLHAPSNMLLAVFDRRSDLNEIYPPAVIKFMHTVPPDDPDGLSLQERLISSWVKVGRIPTPDSSKGREKIIHLTSQPGDCTKQSIEDLDDRQAMLHDLRVRASRNQQDLAALLVDISTTSVTNADPDPLTNNP